MSPDPVSPSTTSPIAASDVPATSPDAREVVLAARNVSKSYGAIQALKRADFDIHRGQVTTLLSQRGVDIGSTDIPFMPRYSVA